MNPNPSINDGGIPEWGKLGANNTTAALCWLLFGWDLAHKIELALGDCRSDKKSPDRELNSVAWYAEAAATSASIVSVWCYGKMYEGLLEIAAGTFNCFCSN